MRALLLMIALGSVACGSSPIAPSPAVVVRVPSPDPDPKAVLPRGRNGLAICPAGVPNLPEYCDIRP